MCNQRINKNYLILLIDGAALDSVAVGSNNKIMMIDDIKWVVICNLRQMWILLNENVYLPHGICLLHTASCMQVESPQQSPLSTQQFVPLSDGQLLVLFFFPMAELFGLQLKEHADHVVHCVHQPLIPVEKWYTLMTFSLL